LPKTLVVATNSETSPVIVDTYHMHHIQCENRCCKMSFVKLHNGGSTTCVWTASTCYVVIM